MLPDEGGEVVGTHCGISLNLLNLRGEKVPTVALVGSSGGQCSDVCGRSNAWHMMQLLLLQTAAGDLQKMCRR
jgi:hypothetical protein